MIDYLAIGHIAKDLTPDGHRPGGTVAYASLTARAMGYRPGLVTAYGDDLNLGPLAGVACARVDSQTSTTFENIYGPGGRTQFIRARAAPLTRASIPANWLRAPLIHLAPLAREFDPAIAASLTGTFVGLTPQGWLREWDTEGRVSKGGWPEALETLPRVNATVLSIEDLGGDWAMAEHWAKAARVLVVTGGRAGCTVFAQGHGARQFAIAPRTEVDPTGAGDIFAAAFFVNFYETGDPWASARLANQIAALSVTRVGLDGAPTAEEIGLCRIRAG